MPNSSRSQSPTLGAASGPIIDTRWDWLTLVLLGCLLVFMPLTFGAVEPWSEAIVVLAAATLSLLLPLRALFDQQFQPRWSWTYLPLCLVVLLIGLQLVPLPAAVLSVISPENVRLRTELLGADASSESSTISLAPHETAHDLIMALVFAALFIVTACSFRSTAQIKRVLTLVFIVGCLEAAVALLQILTLSTKIHWAYPDRGEVVTSGSFINYSHFCQFVNLALGAGLALLLVRMKDDSRRRASRDRPSSQLQWGSLPWDRYLRLLAGLVLCAVAVLTSMSRNGALSLFIATGVMGVLLYCRGALSARGWLLGMAPWCVLGVLFLTGFDAIYQRLATLEDGHDLDYRWVMTTGALRAWQDFPVLGAGLGVHEFLFPLYDTAITPIIAEHADNDWAQLLEEFGMLGAIAVLAFVIAIFATAGRLMFRGRTTLSIAAFGLCMGLIATAVHSLSDFGQHLPAVFSMTAVVSGLVVAIGSLEQRKTSSSGDLDPVAGRLSATTRRTAAIAALVGWGVLWGWAGRYALAAYRGEAWANVANALSERIAARVSPIDDDQAYDDQAYVDQMYIDLLAAAEQARDADPANQRHSYWLNAYRWYSIGRTRDADTGDLLLHPEAVPIVGKIADELATVRARFPLYGPPYGMEGELRHSVLGQAEGAQLIRNAAKLAPHHAPSCFVAGQLAIEDGNLEEAKKWLNRTVALQPARFAAVAKIYLIGLNRPDLARELAGNDHRRMSRLAQLLEAVDPPRPAYSAMANELRSEAVVNLRERVEGGEATASELARLAAIETEDQHLEMGISLYRRALGLDYQQIGWRLALARALADAGDREQALSEAKRCLRLSPHSDAATKMIEQLSE